MKSRPKEERIRKEIQEKEEAKKKQGKMNRGKERKVKTGQDKNGKTRQDRTRNGRTGQKVISKDTAEEKTHRNMPDKDRKNSKKLIQTLYDNPRGKV